LAARILIAPAISLAWEIYPFRMSELVAHEVEIPAVDGCRGHKSYHLVQGDAACHGRGGVTNHHMPVHLFVDKTENHRLVAHQRLIVALDV